MPPSHKDGASQGPPKDMPSHDAHDWLQRSQEEINLNPKPDTRGFRTLIQIQTTAALQAGGYYSEDRRVILPTAQLLKSASVGIQYNQLYDSCTEKGKHTT